MNRCVVCKKSHKNKKYCSHKCRNIGAGNKLRSFNKARVGKKYEDFFGKKLAEKTKEKISKTTRKHSLRVGRIPPSRKGIKSTMPLEFFRRIGALSVLSQDKKKKPTSIEKKVYEYLTLKGVVFKKQHLIKHFIVDAYIPSLNLVIEADGEYWHSLEKNIKRDRAKSAYLLKCGYELLRLKESEINNGEFIKKLEWRFK